MLQDEAVLHQLQDTPYRLCSCEDDAAWTKVLAVKWNPCSADQIYICSQDGKLRRFEFSTGTFATYNVVFRAFSVPSQGNAEEGRVTRHHWDKFEPIPGRDGEFVFLLGVSKAIYYSALPGCSTATVAFSTRADDMDYSYGTPILELWNHSTRITSLEPSPDGCVLASGNEDGAVHLVQLQQPASSSSSHWLQNAPTLEDASLRFKAHNGPIFAFAWVLDSHQPRSYRLATGSQGHVVRLWGISTNGPALECTLLSELHTATSLVLSLSSAPYFEIEPASNTHNSSTTGANESRLDIVERLDHVLCAGTDQGSLYIWRLSDNQPIFLIHHTEHPIIHVSMCSRAVHDTRFMLPQVEVVLATVDTVGSLRLYDSADSAALQTEGGESAPENAFHTVDTFVFAGQMDFDSAVVACSFSRGADNCLVAGTSTGQLRRWQLDQLPHFKGRQHHQQQSQQPPLRGSSSEAQPRSGDHSPSRERLNQSTPQDRPQDRHVHFQTSQLPNTGRASSGSDASNQQATTAKEAPARSQRNGSETAQTDTPELDLFQHPQDFPFLQQRRLQRPEQKERSQSVEEEIGEDSAEDQEEQEIAPMPRQLPPRPTALRSLEVAQSQAIPASEHGVEQRSPRPSPEDRAFPRREAISQWYHDEEDQDLKDVMGDLEALDAQLNNAETARTQQKDVSSSQHRHQQVRPRRKARPVPQPPSRAVSHLAHDERPIPPVSTFADATPNSVLRLGAAADEQERRANAVTEAEVSLTSEDFRDATRGLSVPVKEQRYYDLISVNSDTSSMIMRGRPKPKRQVDPAWLKRRSELAPTREELQRLQIPKPRPEIVITNTTPSALQRMHDTINHFDDHLARPKVFVDIHSIGRPAKPAESLASWHAEVNADYRHSTRLLLQQTF